MGQSCRVSLEKVKGMRRCHGLGARAQEVATGLNQDGDLPVDQEEGEGGAEGVCN